MSTPAEQRLLMDQPLMNRPLAGIVLYHPDLEVLSGLISAIAPEIAGLTLVCNTPLAPAEASLLEAAAGNIPFRIDDAGGNIGLGLAYQRIMAGTKGKRVILFDQDSSPPPGMITSLMETMDLLQKTGQRPAIAGPKPVSASPDYKSPTIHRHSSGLRIGEASAVWFTISSGSLVEPAAFAAIGDFRGDFFIDAIDVEWGFRAWSKGYSCWLAENIEMPHRLGGGHIRIPLLGWQMPAQPPMRLYTYARNQAAMLRLPYIPGAWKRKACLYLMVQTIAYWLGDHGRLIRPSSIIKGFIAGLAGRLGPPPAEVTTKR